MSTEIRDSLAHALALLDRATPGTMTAHVIDPSDPSWGACEIWSDESDRPLASMVCGTENADAIAAVVNFLRDHGPALLAVVEEMAKLLPCPLCGRDPSFMDLAGWEIHCECGLNLCFTPDREAAAARWNHRHSGGDGEDSARLDFLDRLNAALNAKYGTDYGWKLVLSPMIVRLMAGVHANGYVGDIDLNDQDGSNKRSKSCRDAIDAARAGERGVAGG